MAITSYQIFLTVTEQGSFIKASQILNITPSAISHSIAVLEKDFGAPLLIRGKQGVSLTTYGESILPYVREVLQSEINLRQQVDALHGLERGRIRVGCFNSICNTHLPILVKRFHERYPNIQIQIFQGTYADVIEWLKNGLIDLGFLSKASAKNILPLRCIYQDELFCLTPIGFKGKHKDFITSEEIQQMDFVSQQESTDSDIGQYLEKHRIQVRSSCYVSDDLAAISLISNGFGIGIMPKLALDNIEYPVSRYSLSPKGYRMIGISHKEKNLSPAAKRFYEFTLWLYETECLFTS
ncbi:MAG: hypothetical protein PWP24_1624 [Clostridiales bacterium]|nr:hypothetical protein [Clostridiales bacterium]